jgi:hypothetical protein
VTAVNRLDPTMPRTQPGQAPGRLLEIPRAHDVVPIEHAARLVPGDAHCDPLRDPRIDEVAHRGPPEGTYSVEAFAFDPRGWVFEGKAVQKSPAFPDPPDASFFWLDGRVTYRTMRPLSDAQKQRLRRLKGTPRKR